MTVFFGNSSGNILADRRYGLGQEYAAARDFAAAADLFRQGLELAPEWPPLHFHLGEACRAHGDFAAASAAFTAYLARDPEDIMGAGIKLALMGAAPAPAAMPAAYVRSLFDQYAPRFEKALVEELSYQTPNHMVADVMAAAPRRFENALDLGCGTGLAAAAFKDHARRFTGVDLAPAMIGIARGKGLYAALYAADIGTFLKDNPEVFDLVLSADVFVYMGELEEVFGQIAAHMAVGGIFCFSVQAAAEGTWTLGPDHRYAHARAYVERCAEAARLACTSCRSVVLRRDGGRDVAGLIFVCRKKA